jgi:hypothetical protein
VAAVLWRPDVGTAALTLSMCIAVHALAAVALAVLGRLRPIDSPFAAPTPAASRLLAPLRTLLLVCALISAGLSALRHFDLIASIGMAVLYVTCAQAIRPYRRSERGTFRRYAINGALAVLSLLLTLALVEVGARLTIYGHPPEIVLYDIDPVTKFELRPNTHAVLVTTTEPGVRRSTSARVSRQGVRGPEVAPKTAGEFRIILAGDSYVFGIGVEDAETMSAQCERLLREWYPNRVITVINLGVSGTTVTQHLGYLHDRGFDFQPDLVIEAVFPGNDVLELLADEGIQPIAYPGDLEGRYIRTRALQSRRQRVEFWLAQHSRAYLAFRNAVRGKAILRFLAEDVRFLPRIAIPKWTPTVARPAHWEGNLTTWYPELETGFDQLVDGLVRMRDDCAERGVDFAIFCIPAPEEIASDLYDARIRPLEAAHGYTPGKAIEFVKRAATEHDIPIIAVDDALRAHPEPRSLYFSVDGHTTPEGNRVVAGTVRDFVAARYLGTPEHRTGR